MTAARVRLREAILTANTNKWTVRYFSTNISGTIALASPLPFITNSITIMARA